MQSITVRVTDEERERIRNGADRSGLDEETYIRRVLVTVEGPLALPAVSPSRDAVQRFFMVGEQGQDLPLLPAEAMTRESIYGDSD